jgi:predicted TIM-barrel fold metal-dependent hydrolase
MEPYDTWWNAIGHKWGDRTPRVIDEYQGKKGKFFYTGYQGAPVSEIRGAESAVSGAEEEWLVASGYIPEARVRFQQEAGVKAEVLNATRMLGILRNPDAEAVRACSEVFNDWIAEFVSYDPKRLIGASIIPMHDADWAADELERTTKRGLLAPLINCAPPIGCLPYRDKSYDRFWAIAEEADVPVQLHILTGKLLDPLVFASVQSPEEREDHPGLLIDLYNEVQAVLANDFIFGGILDRFPKLKIICAEFELSWVPSFMATIDRMADREGLGSLMFLPDLPMPASDYMRTRVWYGLTDDVFASQQVPIIGADRPLWASDFPHPRSIGLETQDAVATLFESLPREDQEKVLGGNAAKVFNIV